MTSSCPNVDNQARLLAEYAEAQNLLYPDLTPCFQEEAGGGVELYCPFDTHWNQRGHDLAGQTLARTILSPK